MKARTRSRHSVSPEPRLKSIGAAYQQQCQLAMSGAWTGSQARSRSSPARHRGSARRRSSCSAARAQPWLAPTSVMARTGNAPRATGREERLGELNPMQRGGEPVEIARAALYLASDEASYVNGTALVVDGGLSSSHPTAHRFDLRML